MDMVFHHLHRVNLHSICFRNLSKEILDGWCDLSNEHSLAVFRCPDNVILQVINSMGACFVGHTEIVAALRAARFPPHSKLWGTQRDFSWIDRYHDRTDDAGRFARRLLREMDSLWVFLVQHGVEPTNNRAERALRFGVQWRKRSLGTASDKGNRWVERLLSLKETCRLRAVSTYQVLVDAMTSLCTGQQPHLAWLQ